LYFRRQGSAPPGRQPWRREPRVLPSPSRWRGQPARCRAPPSALPGRGRALLFQRETGGRFETLRWQPGKGISQLRDGLWSPDGRFLTGGIGPDMQCESCRADVRTTRFRSPAARSSILVPRSVPTKRSPGLATGPTSSFRARPDARLIGTRTSSGRTQSPGRSAHCPTIGAGPISSRRCHRTGGTSPSPAAGRWFRQPI
jgi:hypothetical protein